MTISDAVARRTLALRGARTRCPTCGRSAKAPFRHVLLRVIVAGCSDAHHSGSLVPGSQSALWHVRAVGREFRRSTLAELLAQR